MNKQLIKNLTQKSIYLGSICLIILFFNGCQGKMNKENKEVATLNKEVTTPSGLKYIITQEGTQAQTPTRGKVVTVHYTGWLDENGNKGKKFDSSVDRGTPFQFVIGAGQVIKGWDEGVMGMKVGEKRTLIIPAAL